MIFGILALADDSESVETDYSMSLTEVYIKVSKELIINQGQSWLLSHGPAPLKACGLPSWCPDWSQPHQASLRQGFDYSPGWLFPPEDYKRYKVAGFPRITVFPEQLSDEQVLSICGWVYDDIIAVQDLTIYGKRLLGKWMASIIGFLIKTSNLTEDEKSLKTIFLRTARISIL